MERSLSITGENAEGATAGAPTRAATVTVPGEHRCSACGYAVVVRHVPSACPMCRGTAWEAVPWRPFTRAPDVETELRRL